VNVFNNFIEYLTDTKSNKINEDNPYNFLNLTNCIEIDLKSLREKKSEFLSVLDKGLDQYRNQHTIKNNNENNESKLIDFIENSINFIKDKPVWMETLYKSYNIQIKKYMKVELSKYALGQVTENSGNENTKNNNNINNINNYSNKNKKRKKNKNQNQTTKSPIKDQTNKNVNYQEIDFRINVPPEMDELFNQSKKIEKGKFYKFKIKNLEIYSLKNSDDDSKMEKDQLNSSKKNFYIINNDFINRNNLYNIKKTKPFT